jgi:hypothetical protein
MPDGPRYDDDFYAWTRYQAEVLRTLRTRDNRFDRENVAEEIETVGRNERDSIRSHVRRILEHLLELAYSPAGNPRYGWMRSVIEARGSLDDKLSASLRRDVEEKLPTLYEDARESAELALREYGEHAAADALPMTCPYTLDQVLQRRWYPEPEERK